MAGLDLSSVELDLGGANTKPLNISDISLDLGDIDVDITPSAVEAKEESWGDVLSKTIQNIPARMQRGVNASLQDIRDRFSFEEGDSAQLAQSLFERSQANPNDPELRAELASYGVDPELVASGKAMDIISGGGELGKLTESIRRKKVDSSPSMQALIKDAADLTTQIDENTPATDKWSAKGITSAILGSGVEMLPAIGVSLLTKKPGLGAGVFTGQAYGTYLSDGHEKGLTRQQSRDRAVMMAGLEGVSEAIPLGKLFEPGTGLIKNMARGAGTEGAQEVFTEAVNIGYDMGILGDEMTLSEAIDQLAYAGVVGAGMGGPMGALSPRTGPEAAIPPMAPVEAAPAVPGEYSAESAETDMLGDFAKPSVDPTADSLDSAVQDTLDMEAAPVMPPMVELDMSGIDVELPPMAPIDMAPAVVEEVAEVPKVETPAEVAEVPPMAPAEVAEVEAPAEVAEALPEMAPLDISEVVAEVEELGTTDVTRTAIEPTPEVEAPKKMTKAELLAESTEDAKARGEAINEQVKIDTGESIKSLAIAAEINKGVTDAELTELKGRPADSFRTEITAPPAVVEEEAPAKEVAAEFTKPKRTEVNAVSRLTKGESYREAFDTAEKSGKRVAVMAPPMKGGIGLEMAVVEDVATDPVVGAFDIAKFKDGYRAVHQESGLPLLDKPTASAAEAVAKVTELQEFKPDVLTSMRDNFENRVSIAGDYAKRKERLLEKDTTTPTPPTDGELIKPAKKATFKSKVGLRSSAAYKKAVAEGKTVEAVEQDGGYVGRVVETPAPKEVASTFEDPDVGTVEIRKDVVFGKDQYKPYRVDTGAPLGMGGDALAKAEASAKKNIEDVHAPQKRAMDKLAEPLAKPVEAPVTPTPPPAVTSEVETLKTEYAEENSIFRDEYDTDKEFNDAISSELNDSLEEQTSEIANIDTAHDVAMVVEKMDLMESMGVPVNNKLLERRWRKASQALAPKETPSTQETSTLGEGERKQLSFIAQEIPFLEAELVGANTFRKKKLEEDIKFHSDSREMLRSGMSMAEVKKALGTAPKIESEVTPIAPKTAEGRMIPDMEGEMVRSEGGWPDIEIEGYGTERVVTNEKNPSIILTIGENIDEPELMGGYLEVVADADLIGGMGTSTYLYIAGLGVAQQEGKGWRSDSVLSDESDAMYRRLRDLGVPFKGPTHGIHSISAEELAKVDVESLDTKFFNQHKTKAAVEDAAAETNVTPSDAQIEADNYKKGKVNIQGLDIAIENPKGSTRSGTDDNGKAWSVTMNNHYGDIKRTEGADGDAVDVFIGDNPDSENVYVIDQVIDGKFDEHKVMVGFDSEADATKAYNANYAKNWKGLGTITETPMTEFKTWLKDGDTTKPFAGAKPASASDVNKVKDLVRDAAKAHPDLDYAMAIRESGFKEKAKDIMGDTPQKEWLADIGGVAELKKVFNEARGTVSKKGIEVTIPPISQELEDGYNRSTHLGSGRDFNQEQRDTAVSIIDELDRTGNTIDTPEQKAEASRLINKHMENVAEFNRWQANQSINNPSWVVTGRAGRNMAKANAKSEKTMDELTKRVNKLQRERAAIEDTLYAMRPEDVKATQKYNRDRKQIADYVGQVSTLLEEGKPALAADARKWAIPKAFKAAESAIAHDMDGTVDLLKKLDAKLESLGGLVKVVGPRSKMGKLYTAIATHKPIAKVVSKKPTKGLSSLDVSLTLQDFVKDYPGANNITFAVANTQDELPFPIADGDRFLALYNPSNLQLAVVSENFESTEQLRGVLQHEIVVHHGLRALLDQKAYDVQMDRLLKAESRNKALGEVFKEVRKSYANWIDTSSVDGERMVAEEVLARVAEDVNLNAKTPLIRKIINAIKAMLEKIGILPKASNYTEAVDLIKANAEGLRNRTFKDAEIKDFGPEMGYKGPQDMPALRRAQTIENADVPEAIRKDMQDVMGEDVPLSIVEIMRQAAEDRQYKLAEAKQATVDEFAVLAYYEKQANAGALEDASTSAYKLATQSKAVDSVVSTIMNHSQVVWRDGGIVPKEGTKGFAQVFDPIANMDGNMLKVWEQWAGALRAERLLKEGREKLYTQESIDRIKAFVDADPTRKRLFNEAHKGWRDLNKSTLDFAQEAGLVTADQRKIWERDDYVPFYRQAPDAITGPQGTRGLASADSGIRQLRGGTGRLNILENMSQNLAYLVTNSYKNMAMQRIVNLTEGVALEAQPMQWKITSVETKQAEKALKDMGIEFDDLTAEQRKQYSDMFTMAAPAGKDIVSVMSEGKRKYYKVTDAALLRSVTNLGPTQMGLIEKIFGFPKRALTALTTGTPAFALRSFVRDTMEVQTTMMKSAGTTKTDIAKDILGGRAWVKAAKGAKDAFVRNEAYWKVVGSAGMTGEYYGTQPANVRKSVERLNRSSTTLNTARKLSDAYARSLEASELANRLATYDRVIKNGGTEAEAAYQSLDVLNFSRRGDGEITRFFIGTVPFLNARIQGLDRLVRSVKENPASVAMKMAIMTTATMALMALNADREDYWALPEWERDTYWHFWIDQVHYRVPKPFEVGAVAATIPERLYESATRDERVFLQRFGHILLETFSLNPIPQAVSPLAEQMANESFFLQRPIVSKSLEFLPPEQQFTVYTSEAAKAIAQSMPDVAPEWLRSPVRVEALLRGYGGSVAGYALEMSQVAYQSMPSMPAAPSKAIDDVPIIGTFIRDKERTSKYVGRVYDLAKAANETNQSIEAQIKQDRIKEAQSMRREHGPLLSVRKELNRTTKKFSDLNKQVKAIYANKVMTSNQKAKELERITKIKNKLAKETAERYWRYL